LRPQIGHSVGSSLRQETKPLVGNGRDRNTTSKGWEEVNPIFERLADERSLRPQIGHSVGSSLRKETTPLVGNGRDRNETIG